jgi:hypothetical protein
MSGDPVSRASGSWDGLDVVSTLWSHDRLGDISQAVERFSCLDMRSWFSEPGMADESTRSNEEMDPVARERILMSINARLQALAPSTLLFRFSIIDGLSRRVETYARAAGSIKFEDMRINEAAR